MVRESKTVAVDVDNLAALSRAKAFLGQEFLTWLWWRAENAADFKFNSQAMNRKNIKVETWIDDRLMLESSVGQSHTQMLKGGDPSRSPEASYGLRSGKQVKELRLGVRLDPLGEFRCTLDSASLAPKGLIMPTTEEMKSLDAESYGEMRVRQVEVFKEILDELFRAFLETRIAPSWENDTLIQMRDWVSRRANLSKDKVIH